MISGRVTFHPDLEDLLVPIDKIASHPDNPRNGDVDAIAESIAINGFIAPIIAQRSTGYILAGNHRYYALSQMGSQVAPVVWVDVDDTAATRYLLADNRTADLGQYDNSALLGLLKELDSHEALLGSGYNDMDIKMLQAIEDTLPDFGDHASWPTISLTVPPHLKNAFYEFTDHAVSDHERLEALLRAAGWTK